MNAKNYLKDLFNTDNLSGIEFELIDEDSKVQNLKVIYNNLSTELFIDVYDGTVNATDIDGDFCEIIGDLDDLENINEFLLFNECPDCQDSGTAICSTWRVGEHGDYEDEYQEDCDCSNKPFKIG